MKHWIVLTFFALSGGSAVAQLWGDTPPKPAVSAPKPAASAPAPATVAPATAKPATITPATVAAAPTLVDIETLAKALTDAWEKTPMTTRHAVFVDQPAENYGSYTERTSNVFKPGEKLITYVEPVGYTFKPDGNRQDFGVVVDFVLKSPDGKLLAGQEGFGKFIKSSQAKLMEFMLTLTMSVDGAPDGDYVLEYRLKDINSSKTTVVSQPFKIGS